MTGFVSLRLEAGSGRETATIPAAPGSPLMRIWRAVASFTGA